jgi:SAM-dependent methyltransferase
MQRSRRVTSTAHIIDYPFIPGRTAVWREIARYVERDAPACGLAVELGPGYCDFINQFPARRKVALDQDARVARFAAADVELRVGDASLLTGIEPDSADVIFASNFLEHLTEPQLDALLPRIRTALSARGRFIVLQPNYARCAEHYFDDPTHVTVFTDESLPATFARHGLRVSKLVPGLLPFSMNSPLPKSGILTRLYLLSPWKPLAAQMYAVASKT